MEEGNTYIYIPEDKKDQIKYQIESGNLYINNIKM